MNCNIFQNLFEALSEDDTEDLWLQMLREYLSQGGDVMYINPSNGWSFLHYAAENIFPRVTFMLLENGLPVDVSAKNGSTPYLVALDSAIDSSIQNDEEFIDFSVVKILVDRGANTDIKTSEGISKDSTLKNYGEEALNQYNEQFPMK